MSDFFETMGRLFCLWDFPGKNTEVRCHFFPQGIFATQGLNSSLLHCRQILYHLSHYSAIRKNERMPFAATWMDLDIVILSEVSQKQKKKQISYINAAAAAAKSLRSCPTLCDPMDGSPPGSPVPGILQARTLEWVAISFSNA